jgi:hypothetical protein
MNSMKVTLFGLVVFTLCAIYGAAYPRTAAAVSYVPHIETEQANIDATMYNRSGASVYLFHGAAPEIVQPFIGQEFSVFRESAAGCPSEKRIVGKIRVIKSAGDHHLETAVIEGELKEGDIAHLGAIYGLIVLTKERCETLKLPDQEPIKRH